MDYLPCPRLASAEGQITILEWLGTWLTVVRRSGPAQFPLITPRISEGNTISTNTHAHTYTPHSPIPPASTQASSPDGTSQLLWGPAISEVSLVSGTPGVWWREVHTNLQVLPDWRWRGRDRFTARGIPRVCEEPQSRYINRTRALGLHLTSPRPFNKIDSLIFSNTLKGHYYKRLLKECLQVMARKHTHTHSLSLLSLSNTLNAAQ